MPSKIFQPGLLDGQLAIVTGGGSGLGRAAALELAALGAHVVVAGRRQEPLDETVELAGDGRVEGRTCDIREEEQVDALVGGVLERHGRIDLLVNNAGGHNRPHRPRLRHSRPTRWRVSTASIEPPCG